MTRPFQLIAKAWALYRANGMGVLSRRASRYIRRRGLRGLLLDTDNAKRFQQWLKVHEPTADALRRMAEEAAALPYQPLIDVVMPVCDPELRWLRAAVESVRSQVYLNWHLCIADDASLRTEVRDYLATLAAEDQRISVVLREQRGGISAASNAAITLATGEFTCLLDHDDELVPYALFRVAAVLNRNPKADLIYSDECALEVTGKKSDPTFKPDFSPDLLTSMNYIGHLMVCRTSQLRSIGGLRGEFDGSQDYDLALRLTEVTDQIYHVPDILYLWRRIPASLSGNPEAKPYAFSAAVRALQDAAQRRGLHAGVAMDRPGRYRLHYTLSNPPLVSIVVPTKNRKDLLERCITSILSKTTYPSYEILVLDNDSDTPEINEFLLSATQSHVVRVIPFPGHFNWSAINNAGANEARGERLLFLNDDTEVLTPEWLEELVAHGEREQVGAVGAKLLFPDGRLQHAGVVVGMGGIAGHALHGCYDEVSQDLTDTVRNVSAVTGACMLTKRSLFDSLRGFREDLPVAYNDVDYCLRLGQLGYYIVWTPHAKLIHYESASRKGLEPPEDEMRFLGLWGHEAGDRYVNPNLDLDDVLLRIRVSRAPR